MKTFAIAAALTAFATGAFAQNAPYYVWEDGQITYPQQTMETEGMVFAGTAAAMLPEQGAEIFPGANINWSQNYSGM